MTAVYSTASSGSCDPGRHGAIYLTPSARTPEYAVGGNASESPPGLPLSWDEIGKGQLVIAQEDDANAGYWEAMVEAVEEQTLVLRWRDYSNQPKIRRHRHAVALLCPAPTQTAPTQK
jgi:hypothetical protein